MQFGNLNDIAGIPIVAIVAAAAGDQPSAGSEAGGADAALIAETHRQHCPDLLYLFHHFRHPGRTVVQRQLLLLRRS